uniref:Mitochondrial carrier protein n=1 Tax=Mycena chlorophos TaxID=658473 RepID=A0ABQ0M8H3_MYCCL|nr:predicted protein [Mycena chlorophos]
MRSGHTADESRLDATGSSSASSQSNSIQAAVARTATRALGLYFSRPIRLFRPPKLSGWHSLRGLAVQEGLHGLSPSYLLSLVKSEGFLVIPKHFVPPMVVNALLGTVLWATYAEASTAVQPHISHPIANAALAGAVAGGTQALCAAPAENVRVFIEGGTSQNSWFHAWKEVFRGTAGAVASPSRHDTVEEARQLRRWMQEVGQMAGRGWDGLGYTLGKDTIGFAAFFAIFEVTRRMALQARVYARQSDAASGSNRSKHLPQVAYGLTLVSGGVVAGLAYEGIGRPFEAARHAVRLDRLTNTEPRSVVAVVSHKIREEGFFCLFRDAARGSANATTSGSAGSSTPSSAVYRRMYGLLRTLARVGPWGVGFLVYQAYESGNPTMVSAIRFELKLGIWSDPACLRYLLSCKASQ